MSPQQKYWFPAKRFGWGWGVPTTWQGWAVLIGFIVLVPLGAVLFPPGTRVGWFLGYVALLVAGLLAVCWVKGERPRWRWGGD